MSGGETIQEVLAIVWRLQWFSAPISVEEVEAAFTLDIMLLI